MKRPLWTPFSSPEEFWTITTTARMIMKRMKINHFLYHRYQQRVIPGMLLRLRVRHHPRRVLNSLLLLVVQCKAGSGGNII
jgi:hypothetical protein